MNHHTQRITLANGEQFYVDADQAIAEQELYTMGLLDWSTGQNNVENFADSPEWVSEAYLDGFTDGAAYSAIEAL